ncbi:hypothetical protein [Streptomyces sp. NPDC048172]|uniref:hypothetical protein n=1 Tax=Streptomyces sp. NPDC048172 TaxID=3365505 RepID=UPI0037144D1D
MSSSGASSQRKTRRERIRDAEGALDALREVAALRGVVLPTLGMETTTLDPVTDGAPRLSLTTDDARLLSALLRATAS